MKKIILILSALIFLANLPAQSDLHLESNQIDVDIFNPQNFPVVTGQLLNYDPQRHADLLVECHAVVFSMNREETQVLEIAADGSFEIKFRHGLPYQQISFHIGNRYMGMVIAHSKLHITADLKLLKKKKEHFIHKSIQYTGPDAELNTIFNQYREYKYGTKQKLHRRRRALYMNKSLEVSHKTAQIREIFESIKQIQKEFLKKHPSPYGLLIENQRQSTLYADLLYLHRRQPFNEAIWAEAMQHHPIMYSASSFNFYLAANSLLHFPAIKKELSFVREALSDRLNHPEERAEFAAFLVEYEKNLQYTPYDTSLFESGKAKFLDAYDEQIEEARFQHKMHLFVKQPKAKSDLLKLVWRHEDVNKRARYLRKALPHFHLEWTQKLVNAEQVLARSQQNQIEQMLKAPPAKPIQLGDIYLTLKNGSPLYLAKQNSVEDLLHSLRQAFPNKALILDIWTPWCSPCIADMKNSKSKKKELQSLPVEIVYLCVDNHTTVKKWEEKLTELETKGTHLYLNQRLSKQFMDYFELYAFPSYLFIDKKGNLDRALIHRISSIDVEKLRKRL